MKAFELAKMLMKFPDYEVKLSYADTCTLDDFYPEDTVLKIDDIEQVCKDKKVIWLDYCKM